MHVNGAPFAHIFSLFSGSSVEIPDLSESHTSLGVLAEFSNLCSLMLIASQILYLYVSYIMSQYVVCLYA